ncbi:gamma-aminobutyric acid type B receptor subunit 2-like [Dreissena polymorpha]|nr:gamma-aminobutyric acid type B receptor subunit 2-like [Dreissena polymorpha]
MKPNNAAAVIMLTFSTLGCLTCLCFLAFNIIYRTNWAVKMSSPNMNNVIICGCLFMYIEVYVSSFDYLHVLNDSIGSAMCMSKVWLLSVGFTLLFGGMFCKTYRVHYLFREHRARKKPLKDRHLFAMIAVLLSVDHVIIIPWAAIFPFSYKRYVMPNKEYVDNNVIYSDVIMDCHNDNQIYWTIAVYVYKGLMLAIGTFLAWETRHVTIPELNDSKYIATCIYNVVVICIFEVPLSHLLPVEQPTLIYVLQSCLIIFCTTSCACLIFIPKLRSRNKVQDRMLNGPPSTSARTGSTMAPVSVTSAF